MPRLAATLTRAAVFLASLAPAVCPAPAGAIPQDSAFRRSENPRLPGAAFIERAEFGWSGHMATEHWNPITVWIADGGKPFSGALVVTLTQDATQQGRIIVPAAATPGQVIPIDLAAAIPHEFRVAELALVDQSGAIVDSVRAVTTFPGRDEIPLEYSANSHGEPIVAIGQPSITRTTLATRLPPPASPPLWDIAASPPQTSPPASETWLKLRVAAIAPDRAPRASIAYDGVSAVVVQASALGRMEARSREALTTWLLTGGRVVLVVDDPGGAWRTLLPAHPDYNLVNVGDTVAVATPERLATSLLADQRELATHARRLQDSVNSNPSFVVETEAEVEPDAPGEDKAAAGQPSLGDRAEESEPAIIDAAPSFNARTISLTAAAVSAGWSLDLLVGDAAAATSGLSATGPVGLGRLTILGVDPERTTSVMSRDANTAAWFGIMRDVARAAADRHSQIDYWVRSGDTVEEARAIQAGLNDLALDRNPSLLVFVPVMGCAFLLAALVGPVDFVLLKRLNARQRSWATALGWCVLLSAVASWLPSMLRTAPTTVDRIELVDVRLPLAEGSPPIAATTGLTSVFGGKAGDVPLEGFPAGAFVRGVSAMAGTTARPTLPPLTMLQATRQSQDDQALTTAPDQAWVGQWTMRAMLDQSRIDTAIGGRAERTGDGGYRIHVWGLPQSSVAGAWMDAGASTFAVAPGASSIGPDGRLTLDFPGASASTRPDPPVFNQFEDWSGEHARLKLRALDHLPGASGRSRTLIDLLATGRWAVVRIAMETSLTPVTSPVYPDSRCRFTYLRICLPVEAAPADQPPPAPESAP
ncbi:MAG: hypothetical protein L6Q35_01520 [Phycisphaerales bacterium]|nr:hypothetical protein [Phycisphaerales bacterium]